MNNIQLYIDGKLADINYNSIQFYLNKQIADFTDISKRTGEFSYTIKLPLSRTNMSIFKFINLLYTNNKFNKTKNYQCQLYSNNNLLIDGFFILRQINKTEIEGNITNKFSDIFSLLGDKSLRDLNLPEIDFEGTMYPYSNAGTSGNLRIVDSLSTSCLNPSLGFDLQSLVEGYKDMSRGLNGSFKDFRDYYKTSLVSYSNFPADSQPIADGGKDITSFNTIINNFSIDNFMPQNKTIKVLEQIFKDIGYSLTIDNNLLNDINLLMPFFGDLPGWNWLQLSKTSVSTEPSYLQTTTLDALGRYLRYPLCSSRFISNNRTNSLNTTLMKQFTDQRFNYFTDTRLYKWPLTPDVSWATDNYKNHYIATNKLNYDFNNNFSFYSPAASTHAQSRDTGWLYTVPADGEYEFDLDIEHDITISNFAWNYFSSTDINNATNNDLKFDYEKQLFGNTTLGYDGATEGNKTWSYNSDEKYYTGNFFGFIKIDANILDSYKEEFNVRISGNKPNLQTYITPHQLRNWNNENVIAYYSPLFRDLYHGNHSSTQSWRDYIQNEDSILVKANKIPSDYSNEVDVLKYFGFGRQTQIDNFNNKICYDPDDIGIYANPMEAYNDVYSIEEQLTRKLVRMKKKTINTVRRSWSTTDGVTVDPQSTVIERYNGNANTPQVRVYKSKASGNVKFKFRSQLKRGEQIRLYYFTANQLRETFLANNHTTTLPNPDVNWDDAMRYNDNYTDEYKINNLTIKCISDTLYSDKLKLANFLPDISQKEFLQDYIKTNNIYFTLKGNEITFKNKGDFFGNRSQIDLTDKVEDRISSQFPIETSADIIIGNKSYDEYDFKDFVEDDNPSININEQLNNIYTSKTSLDLSSNIFFSTFDRSFNYRKYDVLWNGRWQTSDTSFVLISDLKIPSFSENEDFLIPLNEVNTNYNRKNRMIYFEDETLFVGSSSGTSGVINNSMLVSSLPFSYLKFGESVSNKGLLLNTNRQTLFNDKLSNLSNSSLIELFVNLSDLDYSKIDLAKPVSISNTLYYIQRIYNYNPLQKGLTKILFLKV